MFEDMMRYKHIILGGTFDHFHKGHGKFLDLGFKLGNQVTIGITQKNLYKNKLFASTVEDFAIRKKSVVDYLAINKLINRARIIEIKDVFGSSLTDQTIDGIVVTEQTQPNALMINKIRSSRNLRPLNIILAPFVFDGEKHVISSEGIREGLIDRQGRSYIKIFTKKEKLILPDDLREDLRKPLGKVVRGSEKELQGTVNKVIKFVKLIKSTMVIAVGDIIAMSLIKAKFIPDISILDLRSRRQNLISREQNFIGTKLTRQGGFKQVVPQNFIHFEITNDPGTISSKAVESLRQSIQTYLKNNKNQTLIFKGEEDLLALPAILLAPLGSVVLYGQWNLGVVVVEVTEEKKSQVLNTLRKFN